MEDVLESLLFFDELSPKRREELRRQLDADADLADALAHWKDVHRQVRQRFREDLPDRRLLVLYALDRAGHTDLLDAREQEALDAARSDVEQAIEQHPALDDVIATIEDEVADFDATWAEHDVSVAADEAPGAGVSDIDETVGRGESPARAREDRPAREPDAARRAQGLGSFARRLAGGALVVFAAIVVWFMWPSSPATNTVNVAEGAIQRVNLVDGSTVRLVGEAQLVYEQSTAQAFTRRVTLNYGRAFFEIQEQKRPKPFIVETPTATATALGTQFGVAANADSTDVILASGKVKVDARTDGGDAASDGTVMLDPGQHSRVIRGSAPTSPQAVNVPAALEWSGLFVLRRTPVEEAAARIASFYNIEVTVGESLVGEPVTGTFDQNQPPEQILNALASTLNASLEGSKEAGYRLAAE